MTNNIPNKLTEAKATLTASLLSLKELREADDMGICYNLHNETRYILTSCSEFIQVCSQGWEYHTGNRLYPIPEDDRTNLWVGKSYLLRCDLIDYIVKNLKDGKHDSYLLANIR